MARFLLACFISCCALTAHGQEWAKKMFKEVEHDFGTVAKGADVEYRFEVTNRYVENVHLVSVRSSCGCTSPTIENNELKSWEKGYIVAKFNTRTFTGQRGATLTVTIDRPYYAEVQLRVKGNIRGDLVFSPGAAKFDKVDQGSSYDRSVDVSFAGKSDWKIEDIRSTSDFLEVEMKESNRFGGQVRYRLNVRLKENAPAGYLNEQLILVTNDYDSSRKRIPLDVEGFVVPEISVSQGQIVFGTVEPGEKISKRLVVKGKKPFKITSIDCNDKCFEFEVDDKSKTLHVVTVNFLAGEKEGDIREIIRIATDRGENIGTSVQAYATVSLPETEDVQEQNQTTGTDDTTSNDTGNRIAAAQES